MVSSFLTGSEYSASRALLQICAAESKPEERVCTDGRAIAALPATICGFVCSDAAQCGHQTLHAEQLYVTTSVPEMKIYKLRTYVALNFFLQREGLLINVYGKISSNFR